MPKSQAIPWIGRDHKQVIQLALTKKFWFCTERRCYSSHAGRATNTTLAAISIIHRFSSISFAVRSGKEVKTGPGTSAQCGMGRRAESKSG